MSQNSSPSSTPTPAVGTATARISTPKAQMPVTVTPPATGTSSASGSAGTKPPVCAPSLQNPMPSAVNYSYPHGGDDAALLLSDKASISALLGRLRTKRNASMVTYAQLCRWAKLAEAKVKQFDLPLVYSIGTTISGMNISRVPPFLNLELGCIAILVLTARGWALRRVQFHYYTSAQVPRSDDIKITFPPAAELYIVNRSFPFLSRVIRNDAAALGQLITLKQNGDGLTQDQLVRVIKHQRVQATDPKVRLIATEKLLQLRLETKPPQDGTQNV